MKINISPEDYQRILKNVKLVDIQLTKINAELNENFSSDIQNLNVNVKERKRHKIENGFLVFYYNYTLNLTDKENTQTFITLKAQYKINYKIEANITVPEEFVKIFAEYTVSMIIWPYFRELVYSTLSRMELPPLILPMKKIISEN